MSMFEIIYKYKNNNEYDIVQKFEWGEERILSDNHHDVIKWIADGNIPNKISGNKYVIIQNGIPVYDETQAIADQLAERWEYIRQQRNQQIINIEWRVKKYENQVAAGVSTTDTKTQYESVLNYIQELRDIPNKQSNPYNIVWPNLPT